MNRKTVQRHYRLLRTRLIAEEEDCPHGEPSPVNRNPERLLAVVSACDLGVKVNFPPEEGGRAPGAALIYLRRNREDPVAGMGDLQLWIPAGCARMETEAILKFWGFAGRLAGLYRGRCWRDLPAFLQEVAFRCNHRDDPEVIGDLARLLVAGEGKE